MKFVCLGYYVPTDFERLPENERNEMIDDCCSYDDVLRSAGHFRRGEALQLPQSARTVRWKNGKAAVTDGPYAETKEVLGGILILEARDLDHAVELISKHPGIKNGPFEIRPAADMSEMIRASEQRRSVSKRK